MIELRNVSRRFTRSDGTIVNALENISIDFRDGEFVCLIGPSGHGKTTMLNLISGLLAPSKGELLSNGKPITGPGPDRGMVFQKDSVFPWMRVIRNIEYGLRARGMAKDERRAVARKYLEAVGLSAVERSWPRELSGGMLKRVAVATVFANGGEVLLLDEPFSALDYVTKRQLHSVLLDLWAREESANRTVVFVTHDVDEALTLADRIVVVRDGGVVEDLRIDMERPRGIDDLARPEVIAQKHLLLRHLGLVSSASRTAATQ
ncbi:ABC transporter ATP-binding protein [Streptomyces sp. NPDC002346]